MQVVDDKLLFEINNEFEDVFGREPLEAFVTDIDEIVHERLGAFFDIVTDSRAMTSPMAAGRAFRIAPARSYPDVSALAREAARKVANPKWRPSVRVEVNFVIAGEIEAVRSLAGEFVPMMSGCGALAEFSTSFRKPDLAGIPHRRPVLTLASVATSGAGKAG